MRCARAARPPRPTSPRRLRELIAAPRGASRSRLSPPTSRACARSPKPPPPRAARWWWSAARWIASSQVARETGYLEGINDFRSAEAYGYLPPDKVVALCTGSQGEPRAALARIAEDQHPEVTFSKGDTVIFSSRTIPGNEKAVGSVINGLVRQGIEVITDRTHLVHVSGHPRRAEMEELYRLGAPAHRHSGARRGAASVRARQARARGRRRPKSCCAATAIWCDSRPARPA